MDLKEEALALHQVNQGKFAMTSKVRVADKHDLSLAYSPGVAGPCLAIAADPDEVYEYTAKGNLVAVVSDGTAVLELGDIGPLAALPVMEGKALLFKTFANVDAVPVIIGTKDVGEIVRSVALIAPTYGGINLETSPAHGVSRSRKPCRRRWISPSFTTIGTARRWSVSPVCSMPSRWPASNCPGPRS